MRGEEALDHGARAAGVGLVAGYPGSPGTGVLEHLARTTAAAEVHVEW
jgi:indolepyruvate ferredoxin oxidoreductase alpha subunit